MNKMHVLICTGALFFGHYSVASNSWYRVNNYQGTIGPYPVHMSLQSYDPAGNVDGSYYYDRYHAPIILYGRENAGTIELCEVASHEDTTGEARSHQKIETRECPFKLVKNDKDLQGVWKHNDLSLTVALTHTSAIAPLNEDNQRGEIEIPFWGQTEDHSFMGIYEKEADLIIINRINIINKKEGRIVQVIDPRRNNCDFGFYMTRIYQNVENFNQSVISLNCYSTTADITVDYKFDKRSGKFVKLNN